MKSARRHTRQRAMALVIVLGALVLITLLCVAFFASTSRELTASKSYASGISARFYADGAVNLVLGQLRAATTVDDPTKVWTSQPGLLRQFDNQGRQTGVFKLYSSDKMLENGSFTLLGDGGIPADVPVWSSATAADSLPWNRDPGVYTDLNAPIAVDKKLSYPILNPGGLGATTKIQGFDVSAEFGLPDTEDQDGDGDKTEIGQIPMPVKWIYVLKDGRLATALSAGDKTVKLSLADGSAVPDSNPPVARIAFWTDDDTCRLNINTASEGSYWMLPVAAAADDSLSSGQINSREYQRYPGHPATTSLSPALDFLTTSQTDLRNFIFTITPRIAGRGSQFGTRRIGYAKPVELDDDRLYASIDDLLFLPNFDTSTGERYRMNTENIKTLRENQLDFTFTSYVATSMTGTPYNFSTAFSLDPSRLELLRFFLTANSNAPEVNLFGKPRVSLWPVDTRSGYQSAYDKLLAFCATVGGSKYYFQRQNPNSRTEDYYSISRNRELYSYLETLTSTAIPGLGGAFSSKYAVADREEILTSIFDWIRTVNIAYRDKAGVVQPYAWQPNSSSDGTTKPPALPGSGQVLPIKIEGATGFGRFPTLSKAALGIVREAEIPDPDTPENTIVKYRAVFLMETYVPMMGYAAYVPNYQISVAGLGSSFEAVTNIATVFTGTTTEPNSTKTTPITFNDGSIKVTVPANVEPFSGRAWGGTQGFNNLFLYSDSATGYTLKARNLGSDDPESGYPFVSGQFEVSVKTEKKDLLRVAIKPVNGATVQTVNVQFKDPQGSQTIASYSLPFETFEPVAGASLGDPAAGENGKLRPLLQERINQMAEYYKKLTGGNDNEWLLNKSSVGLIDVVRGLELKHGDLRLLALHGTDTDNVFIPHKDYRDILKPQAHSLLGSGGSARVFYADKKLSASRGFLVLGTAGSNGPFNGGTQSQYFPQAPSDKLSIGAPGDFSTGIGSEGDGPHIMKADEGNSSSEGQNWGMSVNMPYQNQLFPWDDRLSDAFSPNRQVSSAVQLGTLPSSGATKVPWQTLLFCPDFRGVSHPGATSPADSALLDLFWMPVVDPYPISQPLSTAGKVNMNSQIAPFTYIDRSTALYGALKSVKVMALPKEHAKYYKWSGYTVDEDKSRWAISYLYEVDAAKTLLFFKERFSSADANENAFKSPSEICGIPLVPKQNANSVIGTGHSDNVPAHSIATVNIGGAADADSLREALEDFWSKKSTLTGDNVMEAPYNHLYPRLTTQSNTYTVYVRAQSLQVSPGVSLASLPENRIRVNGEYRGSFDVERYIDPADPAIPNFANAGTFSKTLYPYYKFRIKGARQFLPQ